VTTSSQPTALGQYLVLNGFTPNPGNAAWLDRDIGQQIQPGYPGRRDHRHDRRRSQRPLLRAARPGPSSPRTGGARTKGSGDLR
jgi:hypothetical protein